MIILEDVYLQAFGIGAFEDEDDDVYTVDHMSNYDRVMGGPDKDKLHGWTAPKHRGTHILSYTCVLILEIQHKHYWYWQLCQGWSHFSEYLFVVFFRYLIYKQFS